MPENTVIPMPRAVAKWYELKMEARGRASLEIRGTIGLSREYREWGMETAGTVLEFEEDLKALGDVSDIDLYIFSYGGYVWDALAIHNILSRHPARVHGHVDGVAASAATIVLMAADEIEVPANAYLMIHNAAGSVWGDHREMEKAAARLAKFSRDIANLYVTRIEDSATAGGGFDRGATLNRVIEMMDEETWLTGDEAVALGLADTASAAVDIAACAVPMNDSALLTRTMNLDRMPEPVRALFDNTGPTNSRETNIQSTAMPAKPTVPAAAPAASAAPAAPSAPAAPTSQSPDSSTPTNAAPSAAPPEVPGADGAAQIPTAAASPVAAPPASAPLSPDAGAAAQPAASAAAPAPPTGPVTMEAIGNLLTNALTPMQQKLDTLQAEVDTQKNLAATGASPTAWGGGQPAAAHPRSGDPSTPPAPVDYSQVNPRALIKQGREAMHKKD